jgi:hypothetical protein
MTDATTTETAPTETNLEKALEAAGWVHPNAPAGFPTPGHAQAAAMTPEEVDHLKEIALLATQAKTASPAGVELISDQILAHVAALQEPSPTPVAAEPSA